MTAGPSLSAVPNPITTTGTIDLPNITSAASYTAGVITLDTQGRVTSVTNAAGGTSQGYCIYRIPTQATGTIVTPITFSTGSCAGSSVSFSAPSSFIIGVAGLYHISGSITVNAVGSALINLNGTFVVSSIAGDNGETLYLTLYAAFLPGDIITVTGVLSIYGDMTNSQFYITRIGPS